MYPSGLKGSTPLDKLRNIYLHLSLSLYMYIYIDITILQYIYIQINTNEHIHIYIYIYVHIWSHRDTCKHAGSSLDRPQNRTANPETLKPKP